MDQRIRDSLDRYITGNYGEDQFKEFEGAMKTIDLELELDKVDRDWIKYQTYHEEMGLFTLEVPNRFTGEGPIPRRITITIEEK